MSSIQQSNSRWLCPEWHTSGPCAPGRLRRGLTLLELLTVSAIILLLVALLVPSLRHSRLQASRLACAANLRVTGQAIELLKSETGRYPIRSESLDPTEYRGPDRITKALVLRLLQGALPNPAHLYCPTSLATDKYAPKPYTTTSSGGQVIKNWETGYISYGYWAGLLNTFPDTDGQPTYIPEAEGPAIRYQGRLLGSRNPRAVLLGDRTVVLQPGYKNGAGSNHGREGGWFYLVSGEARWFSWDRLAPHPAPKAYVWYWPRMTSQGSSQ